MRNDNSEPLVLLGALALAIVTLVPLWGLLWLWFMTVAWSQHPLPALYPLTAVALLFVELFSGILLDVVKVAKGRWARQGKVLLYGAILTMLVSMIIILQLLLSYGI